MGTKDEDCGNLPCMRDSVVLRDKLMTDAALGGPRPIKSEHSYSLLISSPPPSPTKPGGNPYTPNSDSDAVGLSTANTGSSIDFTNLDHKPLDIRKIDDMEEEYFSTISMNSASSRGESLPSTSTMILKTEGLTSGDNVCPEIKDEPISAPASPSCVPSQSSCDMLDTYDKNIVTNLSTLEGTKLVTRFGAPQTSDSEEDDEEYCQANEESTKSNIFLTTVVYPQNMEVEDYEELCEKKEASHSSRQELPPTPPSSGEDSEGTASCSPERRDSQTSTHVQNHKGLSTPRYYQVANGTHATRQPIHTPLISCQPKGSTGVLTLTEEEKRTLIAEGYPVPTKLPLTKQEEKSLKKVRRKIKNKISAQESRRKKKEYMDGLERRVTMLMSENSSYKDRLKALEEINRDMQKEVQRLQALLQQQQS